jgi:hypothetical protein
MHEKEELRADQTETGSLKQDKTKYMKGKVVRDNVLRMDMGGHTQENSNLHIQPQ